MVVCTVSPNTRDEYDDIVYCLCLAFLQAILVPPAAIANEGNEETDFENRKKKTSCIQMGRANESESEKRLVDGCSPGWTGEKRKRNPERSIRTGVVQLCHVTAMTRG